MSSAATSIGVWPGSELLETPIVAQWAERRGLDAVLWTALRPKFRNQDGVAPTEQQALDYLRALEGERAVQAERYVRMTPSQIVTPFRTKIEAELGWTPHLSAS